MFENALKYECDNIFALGDYGYWEHRQGGPEFLQITSEFATLNNIPFYWLDGNHENHVMLRRNYQDKVVDDGMWEIRDNLFYSPRGNRFTWDGIDFMTMGGAYSIDRAWRKIGESWWWEEEITDDEVAAAISDPEPVDVLLSHDVPSGTNMSLMMARRGYEYRNIPASEAGRKKLRRLVDAVRPRYIYHGHYHVNYKQEVNFGYGTVQVTGLNCDETGTESIFVLDTGDFK